MNKLEHNRALLRAAMVNSQGRFFTVSFIKKDGSERVMNARLGVTKPLVGGKNTVAHIEKYITVYEGKESNYRNVNLDTVYALKANGATITIDRESVA